MSRTDDARDQTMIMVQLHADRRAINEGIHHAMVLNKELGQESRVITILDRISGGRHDFNRIKDWKTGQVVMASQRYLHVTGVDQDNSNVTLKDEAGRTYYWSPQELNATEFEVFEERNIELRTGDSVRLSKTQKQAGHAAHEQYRVEELRSGGEIVLRNSSGIKVIDPGRTTADRHVDYSWAVTGYGAQGASARYSLALEGVEGARERMSGARAFYINVSRAKDHVQIVTDDRARWTATLGAGKKGPATAHDALIPEPERGQARRIWSMGQPASKTAIGRAFLRAGGLSGSPVTARIIPPTRKFPEPHLALPVYDGNGKAAGLTMVPLRAGSSLPEIGSERRIFTGAAQAALLQKSRNGETFVVDSMEKALDVARTHPASGVLLRIGDAPPSAQLMKVSGGDEIVAETVVRDAVVRSQSTPPIPQRPGAPVVPADLPHSVVMDLVRENSRLPDAPVVPEIQSDIRHNGTERGAEEKLAGVLSHTAQREKAVAEEMPVANGKIPEDEEKLAVRLKDSDILPSAEPIRIPEEKPKEPVAGDRGEAVLAAELSKGTPSEKAIAAGLNTPLQHEGQERLSPELTQEPSRHIQKER